MHKQATDTSCGIAAALQVATKHNPHVAKYARLNAAEAAAEQARVHRIASHIGLPWPKALGTSTWALTSLLESATGCKYRSYAWFEGVEELALDALETGHDVAFYTGGGTLKLKPGLCRLDAIPRHVITASMQGRKLKIFEPSTGRYWTMTWDDFLTRSRSCEREPAFGNWQRVIVAVIPKCKETL